MDVPLPVLDDDIGRTIEIDALGLGVWLSLSLSPADRSNPSTPNSPLYTNPVILSAFGGLHVILSQRNKRTFVLW